MKTLTSSKLKVNNIKLNKVETYPNGLCKFIQFLSVVHHWLT